MRSIFICMAIIFSFAYQAISTPLDGDLMAPNFDGKTVKFKTQYDNAGFIYMGVPRGKINRNGTQVGMYAGDGNEAIEWVMELQDDGSYVIVLKSAPEMALEAGTKRLGQNGSKVQISRKSEEGNQRWKLRNVTDGVYQVISQAEAGKGNVLDLAGDDRKRQLGSPVHLWKGHSGTNQHWLIETEEDLLDETSTDDEAEATNFAFDCSSPAVLFDENDFKGTPRYLDEAGQYLMSSEFFNPLNGEKLENIRSVGVNKGWHVSFPGEDGDQVVAESSQSETAASSQEDGVLRLARKLNAGENENECETYVYLKVDQNIQNNIVVSRVKMGEPEAEVIGTIASNIKGLWVAEAEMGDILSFSFAKEEMDFKIPSIAVADYSEKTYLVSPQIQWKDARTRYQRIANAAANRYSFDATEIPPAYIDMPQDQGGGVRKQIFKDLGESDTDWIVVDGDIALKRQFALTVLDYSKGSKTSESVWSKQGFMESSSTNISASGQFPMPGANVVNVKPSGSYGFSESTEESWENNEVFTYSRITSKVYEIALQADEADFTDEFVNAVLALPQPAKQVFNSLEEAKADPAWSAYANKFIANWGTHVPNKVIYGGFFMGVNTESFEDYNKKEISSTDLKAGIEADATFEVEVEEGPAKISKETGYKGAIGYSKSTEEVKTKGSGSSKYNYTFLSRGGQGSSFDNYSVGDNVQPVDISLDLLSELFKNKYFDREIPNLEAKRSLLAWAIYDYVDRNRKDQLDIAIPSLYKMELYEVAVTATDDDQYGDEGPDLEIWGKVKINGSAKWSTPKDGVDVPTKDESFYAVVENNIGQTSTMYQVPDKNGKFSDSDRFTLSAEFKENDGSGDPDDNLGKNDTYIALKDIWATSKSVKQKLELRFDNIGDKGTKEGINLAVRTYVWKVPLKDLGIKDPNNITYDNQ